MAQHENDEKDPAPVVGETEFIIGKYQARQGNIAYKFWEFDQAGDDTHNCGDKKTDIDTIFHQGTRIHTILSYSPYHKNLVAVPPSWYLHLFLELPKNSHHLFYDVGTGEPE
jgi:hypothetical protein